MVDFQIKERYNVGDLRKLVKVLRAPGGCPWDREQTHESIRRCFIEEVYEVCEAIDDRDSEHLREELGDVLLQVVFHADIEEDAGAFDLDGVADGIVKKLIARHPHVFGNGEMPGWEEIKRAERGNQTAGEAMETVAKSLPALWRAEKVSKKAAKAGFDWETDGESCDKIAEELSEVRRALGGDGDVEEELGDLLFAVSALCRRLDVDPERALGRATDKFIARFVRMEREISGEMDRMPLSELMGAWTRAKTH